MRKIPALALSLLVLAFASSIFSLLAHAVEMPLALFSFVTVVALDYLSSLGREKVGNWAYALAIGSVITKLIVVPTSLFMIYLSMRVYKERRSLSAFGLSVAYAYSLAWALFATSYCLYFLPFVLTAVYAVSSESLPRTFNERPIPPLVVTSFLLNSLGFVSYKLLLLSVPLYLVGSRYYELGEFCRRAREARGVASAALSYYCQGHAAAALSLALPYLFGKPLEFLHSLMLGFISIHMFVRFPTMLPPMLRIPNARRYNPAPFAFALLSALLWPYFKGVAWSLYALALASSLYVFVPFRS